MVESEYAIALYDLALEEGKVELFNESLDAIKVSLNDKDFMKLLTTPSIDKENKKRIIDEVFKSLDKTFINFLYVVLDHNRISLIPSIYNEYNKLVLEAKNIVSIQIISAKELTNLQLKQFEKTLMDKYKGKKLEIKNIVNSELIGGIMVMANGQSIDASIKNTLDKLKELL